MHFAASPLTDEVTDCCRYVSNTKIKFMLVLSDPIPKDDELRHVRISSIFEASIKLAKFVTRHTSAAAFEDALLCCRFSGDFMLHMWMQPRIHFTQSTQ